VTPVIATAHSSPETNSLILTPTGEPAVLRAFVDERLPGAAHRRQGRSVVVDALDAAVLVGDDDGLAQLRLDDGAERLLRNRDRALAVHARTREAVEAVKAGGAPVAHALLQGHVGLDVLDDHQWVNVAALTLENSFGLCLFDEQGAGKTVTVVHAIDVLAERREIMTTVIVAPKSMLPEWQRDIERFMGDLYRVELLVGSRVQRMEVLGRTPDVVVCNFETVVSMETELRAYARRCAGRGLLVVDESFNVKNQDARRTRAVRRLREEFDRAVVLCGTPAPNSPHDIVAQFDLVDFGITFHGVDIPEDRDDAVPVVREAMHQRGVYTRHLKIDVLPALPTKTFHRVPVTFAPQQQQAYQAALNDLIIDLRSIDDGDFGRHITSYLARRATLLRICSDPAGVVPGYNEQPGKDSTLDDLLDDWIARRGEKVVLWSFYRASVARFVERYIRFNPVRYDGSVSSVDERRSAVRRFQDDDETMLFVGNAGAAGAGLTLHRARLAVYESMSNQGAHFLQSVDRIHRRGQDRDVEYVVLLCEGSIEEDEYDRLLTKEARSRDLLGDTSEPPITRTSLLDELLASAGRLQEAAPS